MVRRLRICVMLDNEARGDRYVGAHGLSFWVEADGFRIVFDTGVRDPLIQNVRTWGVDLNSADALVLSHGHYDHTGGLPYVLGHGRRMPIYLHPDARITRYSRGPDGAGEPRQVGMSDGVKALLAERRGDLVFTSNVTSIAGGVYLTGAIPRQTLFEGASEHLYLDAACEIRDSVEDDQALYVETSRGIVVVLGCAHAGVVNTLDYVANRASRQRIHAVIGGMHLKGASYHRLHATAEALERYGVEVIAPCHCTGIQAMAFLKSELTTRYQDCYCGRTFLFADI